MASLLRAALEGELGNPPEDGKELMELKGPLSEVFSQALNQVYARPDTPPAEPDVGDGSRQHCRIEGTGGRRLPSTTVLNTQAQAARNHRHLNHRPTTRSHSPS